MKVVGAMDVPAPTGWASYASLPFLPDSGRRGRFVLALALAAACEIAVVLWLGARPVEISPEPNNPHPMEVHAVTLPAPLPELQAVPEVTPPDTTPPPPPPPEAVTPPQTLTPPQPEAEVAPPPPAPDEPPPPQAASPFFVPPPPPITARQPPPPNPVKTVQKAAPPPPKTETAKTEEPSKPPPPPSAPASAGQNLTALQHYAADLRNRVQNNLHVTAAISALNLSGDTTVAITITPDGHMENVVVNKASGISLIDKLALETVRATGFAPFSAEMPKNTLTFLLKVHVEG